MQNHSTNRSGDSITKTAAVYKQPTLNIRVEVNETCQTNETWTLFERLLSESAYKYFGSSNDNVACRYLSIYSITSYNTHAPNQMIDYYLITTTTTKIAFASEVLSAVRDHGPVHGTVFASNLPFHTITLVSTQNNYLEYG